MHFELYTGPWQPDPDEPEWTPKQWDEENEMWMDAETGLPWCDHQWSRVWHADAYNAMMCDLCGERNY